MCPPDEPSGDDRCPTEDDLVAYVNDLVRDDAIARTLESHLDTCATCHALTEYVRSRAAVDDVVTRGSRLAPGARVGRYAILEQVGQGGMGTVYTAYDPDLDRRVALKLVRARSGEGAGALEERLRREAKAMAKLTHPNVVAVHDVGVAEAGVFLAMDYVDGVTLRAWLAETPRDAETIIATFVAAGRGLAAAHRAGIVHRDFKPDNVFVGRDGHVRVGDFGLAHVELAPGETDPESRTALIGTVAYMAPEQLERRPVDARADMFSFAVALWEALAGTPPFPLASRAIRLRAINRGELVAPPRGRIPPRAARGLVRALASAPEDRWKTIDELLAQLAPARHRVAYTLIAGVAIVTIAAAVAYQRGAARTDETCRDGIARVASVWGLSNKAAVRTAMLASITPVTVDAWTSVERRLDRYALDWAAMHRAACEATRKTGEQSEALLDRRMHCLDHLLDEMSSLVAILSRPDPDLVANAPRGAQSLSRLAGCADTAALLATVPLPEEVGVRSAVEHLEIQLSRDRAVGLAGKYREQLSELDLLVAEAKRLSYSPTLAHALFLQALALDNVSEFKRATEVMIEAAYAADAGDDRKLAARARAELVWLVGHEVGEHGRALEYGREVDARLRGLGGDPEIEGVLAGNLRAVYGDLGRMHDALDQDLRALRLREAALGPDDIQTAITRVNLGVDHDRMGRRHDALAMFERALETYRSQLGEHHRLYAHTLFNLASTEADLGRIAAARQHAQRSRELLVEALGPEHNLVASVENVLGQIAYRENQPGDAKSHFERAVAISRKLRGPDHIFTAHYSLALATTLRAVGRVDEAHELAIQALAVYDKAGSNMSGRARAELSEIAEALGHHDEAIREAERAVAILDHDPPDDLDGLVTAMFALAKRLAVNPTTAPRARSLVKRALGTLSGESPDRTELIAWLAAHPE